MPISFLDMDQDGKMDFVTCEYDMNALVHPRVWVWEQTSSGILMPEPDITPSEFRLYPIHPNPFNPTTVLSFELRVQSLVRLKVYDTVGRLVATLVDGQQEAGSHQVTFDATHLPSGLYFYRLNSGQNTATGKMVLLK